MLLCVHAFGDAQCEGADTPQVQLGDTRCKEADAFHVPHHCPFLVHLWSCSSMTPPHVPCACRRAPAHVVVSPLYAVVVVVVVMVVLVLVLVLVVGGCGDGRVVLV